MPAIQQTIESAENDHHQLPKPSIFSIVPLELRIMIAEHICPITKYTASDIENLKNMLFASGWELPEWFWRARLDESLLFESKKPREIAFLE